MSEPVNIHGKLRDRYEGREWALAFEVPNVVGYGSRRCDALAMGLWESKGLHLHGHEIKVSRSDWRKELDDVTKAEPIEKFCHFWWIVAPKGIVKKDELPEQWGLMECSNGTALRVSKRATKQDTEPITYGFMAACLRAFNEQSDLEKQLKAEYARGWNEANKSRDKRAEQQKISDDRIGSRRFARLQRDVDEFERKSGIKITGWNGGNIGKAVHAFDQLNHAHAIVQAEAVAEKSLLLAEELRKIQNPQTAEVSESKDAENEQLR